MKTKCSKMCGSWNKPCKYRDKNGLCDESRIDADRRREFEIAFGLRKRETTNED